MKRGKISCQMFQLYTIYINEFFRTHFKKTETECLSFIFPTKFTFKYRNVNTPTVFDIFLNYLIDILKVASCCLYTLIRTNFKWKTLAVRHINEWVQLNFNHRLYWNHNCKSIETTAFVKMDWFSGWRI